MSNEVAKQEKNELASPEKIELMKNLYGKGLTNIEFEHFLYICQSRGLNPMKKEIYAIKRGGQMTIQTSIDGLRVIAERTKMYAPGRDTEFLFTDKGQLLGAKVYVKKKTSDGTWHEVSATAFLHEYSTGQNLWGKMPSTMIEKVAESRCLRRCFPEAMAGLYSDDEMEQANTNDHRIEIHEEVQETTIPENAIDQETWESLDKFLNGYTELREQLKKLCQVQDLRYIKKNQLQAVRKYASEYVSKLKKNSSEE